MIAPGLFADPEAKLLPFQQEDVQKLKSKRSRLIGNEPGTGKTYEGIALDLLNRAGDGHPTVDLRKSFPKGKLKTLIISPKGNIWTPWDEHLMKLTTEDIYTYSYQTRLTFLKKALDPNTSGYFIINWDSIRIKDMRGLQQVKWFHIIADEIHRAKNRKVQLTQEFWKLKTLYKTGMSGTPADDKPQDLWAILHWLWPNYYTAFWPFVKAYLQVQLANDPDNEDGYVKINEVDPVAIKELHKEMEPWFTRRLKEEVLPDLPPKYYSRLWVDLAPKQQAAYDQMKKIAMAWVDEHEEKIEEGDPIIANAVVAQLTRLQQFACGYLVPLLDEDGQQVYKRTHKNHPHEPCPFADIPLGELVDVENWMCRDVPQYKMTDPSSKLDALMELLKDRGNEPIVVFSRFRQVIQLLETRLAKANIPHVMYHGETKDLDRKRAVERFQAGDVRVFAGTIKSGGVGLTLTRASTMAFTDRLWNPSLNIQAEDREHRITQENAVEIIDIMARNTVDLGQHSKIAFKAKQLKLLLGDTVNPEEVIKELDLRHVLEGIDDGSDA